MPRRLKLSPMQRDIMVTLEEAGGETIGTVIATVKPLDEGQFAREVDALVRLGLIQKEEAESQGRATTKLVLTKAGIKALHT